MSTTVKHTCDVCSKVILEAPALQGRLPWPNTNDIAHGRVTLERVDHGNDVLVNMLVCKRSCLEEAVREVTASMLQRMELHRIALRVTVEWQEPKSQ
jgi:hypothetical protein